MDYILNSALYFYYIGFCDAYLPLEKYPRGCEFDSESNEYLEIGYRFVGMIGMLDPPRPAVPDAVLKCKAAGIKVIMITGDHAVTAKAIARSVNILSEGATINCIIYIYEDNG